MSEAILEVNGLSAEILSNLSYKTHLNKSLKQTFRHFDRDELIAELCEMADWLDEQQLLTQIALDYRIKSVASIIGKYDRYLDANKPVNKVFNDILGFRAFCDNYEDVLSLNSPLFRVADMSTGKANDDGYRGVHLYFQLDNEHYPIEIQYNTLYDRQMNNWLHDCVYKKGYPNQIGQKRRFFYEDGKIKNISEFQEVLDCVLSGC